MFQRTRTFRPSVDQTKYAEHTGEFRLPAQEDVLGDRLVGGQVQLLVDGADTLFLGIVRGSKVHFLTAQYDPALVTAIDAPKNFHQRGLARPVLADQGHNLATSGHEVHVAQSLDARKRLGDATHFEKQPILGLWQ